MANPPASSSIPWRSFPSIALMVPTPLFIVIQKTVDPHINLSVLSFLLSIAAVILGYRARAHNPRALVLLTLIAGWITLLINLAPWILILIFFIAIMLGVVSIPIH